MMKSLLNFAVVAAAIALPGILASPPACRHPRPSANFTLSADAPDSPAIDGLLLFATSVNHLVTLYPSNPRSVGVDSFDSITFFKNDSTHLYTYMPALNGGPNPVELFLLTSPLAGDLTTTLAASEDDFPHYEESFYATVSLWPPATHIGFKPGQLINPGTYVNTSAGPGGWYACYSSILSEYFVYVGTELFVSNDSTIQNPTNCIEFSAKVNITGFELGC